MPEADGTSLDESSVGLPFETETIEDIQNEITSAILVSRQNNRTDSKEAFQFDSESLKNVLTPNPEESNSAGSIKVEKNSSQFKQINSDGVGETRGLDENKPEDRRRTSVKR